MGRGCGGIGAGERRRGMGEEGAVMIYIIW